MIFPADRAIRSGSNAESPRAMTSAFTNSDTFIVPRSTRGAEVDFPEPFDPAMTTTFGLPFVMLRLQRLLPPLPVLLGAADGDVHAEGVGHGGLGEQGLVGFVGAVGVGDLDVVGLMAGHHLVAG